jgi:hypothetical protein
MTNNTYFSRKYYNVVCYIVRLWETWSHLLNHKMKWKVCLTVVSLLASLKVCHHLFLRRLWSYMAIYFSRGSLFISRIIPFKNGTISKHSSDDHSNLPIQFDEIQMNQKDMALVFKRMLSQRKSADLSG